MNMKTKIYGKSITNKIRGKNPKLIIIDDITPIPEEVFKSEIIPKFEAGGIVKSNDIIKASNDYIISHKHAKWLKDQRQQMGEIEFKKEYLKDPCGDDI